MSVGKFTNEMHKEAKQHPERARPEATPRLRNPQGNREASTKERTTTMEREEESLQGPRQEAEALQEGPTLRVLGVRRVQATSPSLARWGSQRGGREQAHPGRDPGAQ